ncbi:diguanylate cyclase [Miltoncostaea oceani]|uniref:diguanylate cyclase n=1 Tax=Miltoncostaea oceani TaxID=2843216 RepID=UPI001C3D7269|nr:diguanylate cyclase [Miltoncostaea oceani]
MTPPRRAPRGTPTAPSLTAVLGGLADGVVVWDRDGAVLVANDTARALLGAAGGALPAAPDLAAGPARRDEVVAVPGADGRVRWLAVTTTTIDDGAVVGVLREMGERHRVARDEALEARTHAAVARVATAVARQASTAELFRIVATEARALLGADAGVLVRLDGGGQAELVESRMARGVERCRPARTVPLADLPAVTAAVSEGRPAVWHRDAGGTDGAFRCRSRAAAPVRHGDRVWGCLVAVRLDGDVSHAAAEALARLADVTGIVVAAMEGHERVADDTSTLLLAGGLDPAATLDAIAEAARRELGADRATVYVSRDAERPVGAVHTTERDPRRRHALERATRRLREELPVLRRLLERPDPLLVIEDVRADPGISPDMIRSIGAGAFAGLRLEHHTVEQAGAPALLGTLFVSYDDRRDITPRDRRRLRSLGALASLALANSRLHEGTRLSLEDAERRAAADPLTGLLNHRSFQERLLTEFDGATRAGTPLSLVLLDLDRFKAVNDTHGHQVGDRVLAEAARRLAAVTRPGDTLARVGGEEFAWLLPGADEHAAWNAAERARSAIGDAPFATAGDLSISAGVCDTAHARDASELFRLADGALYWAKGHGRDVTLRYSPDVVEVLSAQERAERLERSQTLSGLRLLARVVDARDPSTRRHSERVAEMAVRLATAMGWPMERILALSEAALVHDVGKIGVPDDVLHKPARLTVEEFEVIKRHAPLGADIVRGILSAEQIAWVRGHHERYDGRGYPDGLAGEDIPDGARILAVADSWDVMVSVRAYTTPRSVAEALEECAACAGGQFAPEVVAALHRLAAAGPMEPIGD